MSDLEAGWAEWAVGLRTARRAVRSAAVWGVLFGGLVANEALSYHSGFPDTASRERFAATMGENRGLTAVTGPARSLDTLGGFVAWRMMSLMLVAGAICVAEFVLGRADRAVSVGDLVWPSDRETRPDVHRRLLHPASLRALRFE